MDILITIPLSVPDNFGTFAEVQQNLTDLLFRDLRTAKQSALLETFSLDQSASQEQLAAMRRILKEEIELVEKAMAAKTIELLSRDDDHEAV